MGQEIPVHIFEEGKAREVYVRAVKQYCMYSVKGFIFESHSQGNIKEILLVLDFDAIPSKWSGVINSHLCCCKLGHI